MKKLLSAIAISVSAIMAASSAFAAPEHAQGHQPAQQQHVQQHPNNHGNAVKHVATNHKAPNKAAQNQWKAGHKYPTQYRGAGYKVDYKHHKNLSKPGKNQQWYKADGHYILVNTATYAIIKLLGL